MARPAVKAVSAAHSLLRQPRPETAVKIQPSFRPAPEVTDRPGQAASARGSAPAGAAAAGTQVALSATSAALQSPSADVNLERVEAVRNAIRSGQLSIDAGRIADGLIESTRSLLQGNTNAA